MLQKVKNLFHLIQAIIANIYYGFPSRKLKVIGVTGTDGKTTTVHLIYHILKSSNKKVSMISSVYAEIAGKKYETGFHVTTPDIFPLQKFLRKSADARDEYFVLETTSHALDQNRIFGIKFYIGVITNITHEHLDYHKTYENYVRTKTKLLTRSKFAVINEDDESYKSIIPLVKSSKCKIKSYNSKFSPNGRSSSGGKILRQLPKLTKFNEYNYSAAYSVAKILELSDETILKAMKTFQLPPGRMDLVYDKDFKVIIDFAHTPNAIYEALKSLEENLKNKNGRIIHLFGSAGLRDFTKRPLMGEASGQFSNIVILTEEDYRTEDPTEIAYEIAEGLEKKGFHFANSNLTNLTNKTYIVEPDRKKAIEKAVEIARKGDVIILTGKAHEKSLCRGKIEYPWDEKKAVFESLKNF